MCTSRTLGRGALSTMAAMALGCAAVGRAPSWMDPRYGQIADRPGVEACLASWNRGPLAARRARVLGWLERQQGSDALVVLMESGYYGSESGYGYALVLGGEAILGLGGGHIERRRVPGSTMERLSSAAGAGSFQTGHDGATDGHCYLVTVKNGAGAWQFARIGWYLSAPGPHFSPRDDEEAIISLLQTYASE